MATTLNLKLVREPAGACTHGKLFVDDKPFSFTLEDQDRGLDTDQPLSQIRKVKVKSQTAIPRGQYEVVITYSNRFKRQLPLLLNVPGFEGIRIHPGNTAEDTEGCILVGENRFGATITQSASAFSRLFLILQKAAQLGKIYIEIV